MTIHGRHTISLFLGPLALLLLTSGCSGPGASSLDLSWSGVPDRPWPGPVIWPNRVQDWAVRGERLEAELALPMRTAHLLTREVDLRRGEVSVRIEMGLRTSPGAGETRGGDAEAPGEDLLQVSAAGMLLGAGGTDLDPRQRSLIHHSSGPGGGLFLGVDANGYLFASDFSGGTGPVARSANPLADTGALRLSVRVVPEDGGGRVTLHASSLDTGEEPVSLDAGILPVSALAGGVALVAHAPQPDDPKAWFRRVQMEGDGVEVLANGRLGPVLGAMHTLSRDTLRLTAQLFPVSGPLDGSGPTVPDSVLLETRDEGGRWGTAGRSPVEVPGYTATFRVVDWPSGRDVSYRLTYLPGPGRGGGGDSYEGTVRAEPISKEEMVVAAFTGNHNVASPGVDQGSFDWLHHLWFPHEEVVAHVKAHAPDFLFFSGDQVYEGASPTAADYQHPYGDYLYKWYLWLWAFRDLTRDIPSVAIPDDHDVFHGNVWGAGGRPTPPGLSGAEAQDQGGYRLPPEWVNMVQRTQAAELPEPRNPEASQYDIDVYFTDIVYGGVSFAVVEDRKFKSPPKLLLPEADVWNGWAQNPEWDARTQGDVPTASLLGESQERFLDDWAGDWKDGVWMKVVLSQTIFADVATIPRDAMSGSVIPSLPIPAPGEWVEGDKMAADMDSNGWPQSGRNRALRAMRKGFAVHLAGDQHLASTIQYGVEEWGDGPFALCVPSVANFWPRRWYPPAPGQNREPDAPAYTGDFREGFGNLMTVYAVSNPARWGHDPAALHDRAPGYGIARFNRRTRLVSLEAWPRWADPRTGDGPYPGWPVTFRQEEGYGRTAWGYLPTVVVEGMEDPVVQVISEAGGDVLYTLRIRGSRFTPRVFESGSYTIGVGEPGTGLWRVFLGQAPAGDSARSLEVVF